MFALLHGVPWVHATPALLSVLCAFLYLKTTSIYLKLFWGILWLLLLPNTAYIFTDVTRIALHWNSISTGVRIVLIVQYILLEILGLATFLLSMLPLEWILQTRSFSPKKQILTIILFNFLIGYGMVVGKEYINSYVVFTQPVKVFLAAINIITSLNLLRLTIEFGVLCNCIYFLFRNRWIRYSKRIL